MKNFAPLMGKRIRLTEVDSCGRVIPDGVHMTMDGLVSVGLSPEVEGGAEITSKRIDGSICVNEKQSDSFKYFTLNITFCGVHPTALALSTNAEEYLSQINQEVLGFTVRAGSIKKYFAFELWTGLAGVACDDQTQEASGYLLLPFVGAGTVGEVTFDSETAVNFTMSGGKTKSNNAWGTGPYNVVQGSGGTGAKLPTALDPYDHLLMLETGLAVPEVSEEAEPNTAA